MLSHVREYHKPAGADEALRLLQRRSVHSVPLAGGTGLLAHPDPAVEAVVDLSGLGLDYIRQGSDGIAIGAMTTLEAMLNAPFLAGFAGGLLPQAAHHTATRTIRNSATLGGSIVACGSSTDLVVALLALEAVVVAASGNSASLSDLLAFKRVPRTMKLLTEVRLPLALAGWCSAICRVALLPSDQAIVNVATVMRCEGGVCTGIRLAAGGVGHKPLRLLSAERILLGSRLSASDMAQAVAAQDAEVTPTSDILGSQEYRRAMLGVLLQRAVRQCQARESEK